MKHLAQNATQTAHIDHFHPCWLQAVVVPMPPDAQPVKAVILDTETTGLEPSDQVIEVALLPVLFDARTSALYAIGEPYVAQQDPGVPLQPIITKVTGIVDADLKGKTIDWPLVREYLAEADMVVAHNAQFDRGMIDRTLNVKGLPLKRKLWACTINHLDWDEVIPSAPAKKLPVLSVWSGFWYDAHRADVDVQALLYLLLQHKQLGVLYTNAQKPTYDLAARGAHISKKDVLKARKYQWDADNRYWHKGLPDMEAVEAEVKWLGESVYFVADAWGMCGQAKRVDPLTRYGV